MMTKDVPYWWNIIPDDVRINVFDRNVVQIIIKSTFYLFYCWRVDANNLINFYLLRQFRVRFFLFIFKDTTQAFAQETAYKCSSVFFFTYVLMYIRRFGIRYFYYLCYSNCLHNIFIQIITRYSPKRAELVLKGGQSPTVVIH